MPNKEANAQTCPASPPVISATLHITLITLSSCQSWKTTTLNFKTEHTHRIGRIGRQILGTLRNRRICLDSLYAEENPTTFRELISWKQIYRATFMSWYEQLQQSWDTQCYSAAPWFSTQWWIALIARKLMARYSLSSGPNSADSEQRRRLIYAEI